MLRKLMALMVLLALVMSVVPVSAADNPVVYKATITVTKEGGKFQVGFANIEFKKEFIDQKSLPVTIDVEISAENGKAGIDLEMSPSYPDFCKKVHIRVDNYKGLLYDKAAGKNVEVVVKKQQLIVDHFSRHAFS